MKNLLWLICLPVAAQLTTPTTTLSVAVDNITTQWCVASPGSVLVGGYLVIESEAAFVSAQVSGQCFRVSRAQLGTNFWSHGTTSTAYAGFIASGTGDLTLPFSGGAIINIRRPPYTSPCVASAQYSLPIIVVMPPGAPANTVEIANCTGGVWVLSSGTGGGGGGTTTLANNNIWIGNVSNVATPTPLGTGVATALGTNVSGTGAICLASGSTCSAGINSIRFSADGQGAVLPTGDLLFYPTADYSCTINRIDITGYPSGSITVDVWKVNAAIPTSSNKISASAPLTLSSSQISLNGSLSGWTTSVVAGDVFGFNIASVTSVTKIAGTIWCQ